MSTEKTSLITVKRLWIRLPPGFASKHTIDEFYKKLGDNIPKYMQLEGSGCQYVFCIDATLKIEDICKYFGIDKYDTREFNTQPDKFNSSHQLHTNYNHSIKEPYVLTDIIY